MRDAKPNQITALPSPGPADVDRQLGTPPTRPALQPRRGRHRCTQRFCRFGRPDRALARSDGTTFRATLGYTINFRITEPNLATEHTLSTSLNALACHAARQYYLRRLYVPVVFDHPPAR